MNQIFSLSSLLVMPFWFLMIALPRWRGTQRLINSIWIVVAPALLYGILVLPRIASVLPAVMQPTLGGIMTLLGSSVGATIAWVHFLAFDLFVGRWIYLDSRERNLNAFVMAPILFFTLMLGPLGLLTYLIVRILATHSHTLTAVGRRAFSLNRPLAITVMANLVLFAVTLIALMFDHWMILGSLAWIKPAKFAISVSIYAATLLWLMTYIQGRERLVKILSTVISISLCLENTIIALQVIRGTTSHFNTSTPLNGALFSTMGFMITVLWLTVFVVAILLIRQRTIAPVFAWSLRLGVILTLIGMTVGFLMTSPTPAQLALAHATGQLTVAGAHSVGRTDGGPGLPILGWSTVAGDLRVPHFFGMHALQIIPLIGWLLTRRRALRLSDAHRLTLVWTGSFAYFGVLAILVWQALRGQSVVHPDAMTLTAFGAIAVMSVLVSVGVVIVGWRNQTVQVQNLFPQSAPSQWPSSPNPFSQEQEKGSKSSLV